jgi:GMP synthase-like glutamine amidotransferase
MLRIHTIMHVPFEGLGCIADWIGSNGHSVSFTKLYEPHSFPSQQAFDWLIVMGGPMGVYDDDKYHWLADEKNFIKESIDAGKTVIGICLGSQLIAEVLGAKVYPNNQKEIGWMPIHKTEGGKSAPILSSVEDEFTVFHWHGDTFDLPEGSTPLFSSQACVNQAFLYKDKVLGLQFHFEVTPEAVREMVTNGMDELVENNTIQSATTILEEQSYLKKNNERLISILELLAN